MFPYEVTFTNSSREYVAMFATRYLQCRYFCSKSFVPAVMKITSNATECNLQNMLK